MLAVVSCLFFLIGYGLSVPLPDDASVMDRIWQARNTVSKTQLIEMDIVNTPRLQAEINLLRAGVVYDAISYEGKKWPNGVVPYVIDSTANSQLREAFAAAVAEYNAKTCIRFVPRVSQEDYISVIAGSGCYSYIGRQGGKQNVSLGSGCEYKGIAIHEMMHAIGFFHEQSRRDRDSFIKVQFQNIISGMSSNFEMYQEGQANTYGEPYDKKSVMHYGNYAFSANGQKTIISLSDPNEELGQRDGLSEIDVRQINIHYQCGVVTQPPTTTATTRPPAVTTRPQVVTTRPPVVTTRTPVVTTRPPVVTTLPPSPCSDGYPFCPILDDYCTHDWVKSNCRGTCRLCPTCVDLNTGCWNWYQYCTSSIYGPFMKINCQKTCSLC